MTFADGTLGWLTHGQALEVFSTQKGTRVAAWTFGTILRDTATSITAVVELPHEGNPYLAVATTTPSSNTGLICVFDVHRCVIVKAIELPYKITALACVAGSGADQGVNQLLHNDLQTFCGILAAGTIMGRIYLLGKALLC